MAVEVLPYLSIDDNEAKDQVQERMLLCLGYLIVRIKVVRYDPRSAVVQGTVDPFVASVQVRLVEVVA